MQGEGRGRYPAGADGIVAGRLSPRRRDLLPHPLPSAPARSCLRLSSSMLYALLLSGAVAAASADTAHLVLVATTDVHGHATEWDYVNDRAFPGGLIRVATAIDSLKLRYPGSVIVVDAGDLIEGEPFADYYARVAPRDPHPVIDLMNAIGYDVATPGNHEFDYGLPVMARAIAAARFPYVSANIRGLPGDTLSYPPYAV